MKPKMLRKLCIALTISLFLGTSIWSPRTWAITEIFSANGNVWDVHDNTDDPCPDNGAVEDGSDDAFDGYGSLRVRVQDLSDNILVDDEELCDFNLQWDEGRRWSTLSPALVGTGGCDCVTEERGALTKGKPLRQYTRLSTVAAPAGGVYVSVSRAIYAPTGTDYIRYIDTFTNITGSPQKVSVAWGGDLGSDEETTIAGSSSGDLNITTDDTWGVTIENPSLDPLGLAIDPPVGHIFRAADDTAFISVGNYFNNPFTNGWGGNEDDSPAFVFQFTLAPDESKSLAYFIYRGLSEEGQTRPTPAAVSGGASPEVQLALLTSADLQANPDFTDLSPTQRALIVNWPAGAIVYDVCLQDDSVSGNVLLINSTTGEYQYCCNGATFTGTGTIKKRGQLISLNHNPGDRKVVATVDKATHRGTASLQLPHATTPCTITDRNTLNNTCQCNGGGEVEQKR
ncbi:MAG: hypothetical protein AB1757_05950 [Acidobacteriota bacterium]